MTARDRAPVAALPGERCDNCRHWQRRDGEGWGVCLRYPPRPGRDLRDVRDRWPWTAPGDRCGEHTYTDEAMLPEDRGRSPGEVAAGQIPADPKALGVDPGGPNDGR